MAVESEASWLDEQFFKDLLHGRVDSADDSLMICDIELAVPKGDNFSSLLHRVTLRIREPGVQIASKRVLVVKSLPSGEWLRKYIAENDMFKKECRVYEVILPAVYRLFQHGATKFQPLAPSHFPTSRPYTLVLEDLKPLGFTMADRRSGLDLKHCTAALRALATLHATSVALHAADPSCMDIFQEKVYTEEKRESAQKHDKTAFLQVASFVRKWPGYERFGDRLQNIAGSAVDRLISMINKVHCLPVLNHGDFWVNNMMFRYPSSGDEVDIRLLDFQMCRFSSPALDIHYFFNTSLNDDVRQHDRELLLTVYQKELSDVLTALGHGSRALSLEQLQQEMRDTELFGLTIACTVLCLMLANPTDAPNFDGLTEQNISIGDQIMARAYGGLRFRCVFQQLLDYYEKTGLL